MARGPFLQMVKHLPANAGDAREASLIPGIVKIPLRRKWQPTAVFLTR